MLPDLYDAVQEVAKHHLKYGEDLKKDFYGALEGRVRSMLRDEVLVDMYNTESGLSIPELLKYPTIIEMRDLSPENRTLLTGVLTVGISEYLTANPRKGTKYLLVLEEAHHFLKHVGGATGYGEPTIKQKAIDNIVEMLRTQRGKGLGIILIDQLPGSMAAEAVKLPSNIIIHRLTDEAERVLVGRQAQCTDAQIAHIGGMGVGEAVVRVMTDSVPKNAQVVPLERLLRKPPRTGWTDEVIRKAMAKVFEVHPELRASEKISSELRRALTGKKTALETIEPPHDVSVSSYDVSVSEIVSSVLFSEQYLKRIGKAVEGDFKPIVRMLTVVAKKFSVSDADPIPLAERLLLHAAGVLQEPKDTALLSEILSAMGETV